MKFHQIPNVYVRYVSLKVQDLQRSIKFYTEIIGLKLLSEDFGKAIFTADGTAPLLVIEQPENVQPKEPRRTGLYHFALLLPERSDLASIIRHLIKTGYPLQGASDHLVSEALYLADPDGNGIEIYVDRPADSWKWQGQEVVMDTKPLDAESVQAEWKGEDWKGLPEGTIMGHIHLHVSEFAKTKEFYLKGLGFDVVCQYGGQALFISTGGYHHHIGLNTWNGIGAPAPSRNSAGMRYFKLIYPNAETREAAAERLREMGVNVGEEFGDYIAEDPSGTFVKF